MTRLTSPRFGISYPDPTLKDEPADGPNDIEEVVLGVEKAAYYNQGTVALRPVSTPGTPGIQGRLYYATDETVLYYDYGTGWDEVPQPRDTSIEGRKINWHIGITPPVSPVDGDMWLYQTTSIGGNDGAWVFRYTPAAGAHKWVCVGGTPMFAPVTLTFEAFGDSTSYADAAVPGPTITIPRTGYYTISFGFSVTTAGAASAIEISGTPKLGAAAASDNFCASVYSDTSAMGGLEMSTERSIVTPCSATDVIKLQYKRTGVSGSNPTVGRRHISIMPFSVT